MSMTDVSLVRSVPSGRNIGGGGGFSHAPGTIVDYVGFANFPNQVFRRCIKDGFCFNIMVVGQTGLGKSTYLNTLFMAELHNLQMEEQEKAPTKVPSSTVKIESKTVRLVENDVRLDLTVVDTPGFGDLVDNSNCWDPIIKFIDERFADFLMEETKIDRSPRILDKRVHLCLYFIAPTGHSLKQLDLAFLRALQDRVNIVPVIAKADTLTVAELERFKRNIMADLQKNKIQLYEFPEEQQQKVKKQSTGVNGTNSSVGALLSNIEQSTKGEEKENAFLKQNGINGGHQNGTASSAGGISRLPFAVVGSTNCKEIAMAGERKRIVRVREYPWGVVEVDNLAHNDFITLRDMIIRNHLIDLIEVTRNVHYENYRMRNLPKNSCLDGDGDPFTRLEQEMRQKEQEAEETRQVHERAFKNKSIEKDKRLFERAQAMDAEELENRRVLADKRALLERLKQEVADLKRGGNISASSLDSGSTRNMSGSTPEKAQQNNGITTTAPLTEKPEKHIKKRIGGFFSGAGGGTRNN